MPRDVFRFINDLDDETVARISARLEFRATDPGYVAFREAYFAKLPLATARRVVALGCGTGVEVRALRRRPEFRGEVLGVDHSSKLIDEARRRTAEEGLDGGVEYRVGDAHALNLPDADLANRVEEALLGVLVNNPRVMRDMPRLLRQAELDLVEATPHVYADVGTGGFFANLVELYGPVLAGSGLLLAAEVERWRAWQAQAMADGTFFGASNFYTYLARRPAALADTSPP